MKRIQYECEVCRGPINGTGFQLQVTLNPVGSESPDDSTTVLQRGEKPEVCGSECGVKVLQIAIAKFAERQRLLTASGRVPPRSAD